MKITDKRPAIIEWMIFGIIVAGMGFSIPLIVLINEAYLSELKDKIDLDTIWKVVSVSALFTFAVMMRFVLIADLYISEYRKLVVYLNKRGLEGFVKAARDN